MSDITLILESVGRGESQATEELFPLVYEELRRLAAARMAKEAAGHTLQPTALVHEAWLQLVPPFRLRLNQTASQAAADRSRTPNIAP